MDESVAAVLGDSEVDVSLALSDEDLLVEIVCAALAGRAEPGKIALALNLPHEKKRIQKLLHSAEGQRALWKAKRDVPATMAEKLKRRLPVFVEEMELVALDRSDKRTQYAALKDLMDRGGLGATQKVALTSPEAYKRAIADLMDDQEGPPRSEGSEG